MKREKTVKTLSYADILSLSKLFPNSYEFKSNCIGVGDKFIACLAVLFYPSMLDDLILTQLMCMSKYHVSMDFEPIEAERILPQIDRSIKELDSRLAQVNMSVADKDEASEELNDFRTFRIDMSRGQEKALAVTIRFWLKDENEDLLLQRLDALKAEIQGRYGIDCFLPAYEMQEQFLSLTSPSNSVMTPFPLLQTFARQIPFYGTSLRDPHGWYFGHSLTDEVVILDPFAATQQRTSFNMLFVGGMGAGKSSTLKSMMQDALAFGHRVFSLDIEGEQRVLAQ
ncbi:MAG: hypothetical protein Q4P72_06140 [Eubacteriales bacterium]|nr:hypothetical protein [Eubacteriales bacterium]